jgi:hypothetical protein
LVWFGSSDCIVCGVREDLSHFYLVSPRTADLWEGLYIRILAIIPGFPPDWEFLMLAFTELSWRIEQVVVYHLAVYSVW